ncbi:MAG: replication factor C large subunit [Candidatus Methanospirareceae archaeon]
MGGSSVEWTEKYRPKKLREVVGNEKAIEELREWAEDVFKANSKKAAILHGPAGCGKTSAAYALAAEKGWEVIELNASDQRSAGVIRNIVGHASRSATFSKTRRLIILDEADNLHGTEDRGGTKAITEIVKKSTQPIILTANDKYKMGKGLQRYCKVIKFERIRAGTVFRVLKRISDDAGVRIEDGALIRLAKNADGDLRSAINDLQALSMSESKFGVIGEEEIATGWRDVEEDIFGVLEKFFGADGYELESLLSALYSLDKTPEESIQWVYKNFSYEYDDESFLHGLRYLSRADIFLGRVRKQENYKFWRYASSLMAGGVLSAREMHEGRREEWGGRKRRFFRSPWERARMRDGEKSGPIREEIAMKIAKYCKVPRNYALSFILPLLPIFFEDERKASEVTVSLGLDVPQITFLLGDDEEGEEKAKRIYKDAFAVAARRRKAEEEVEKREGEEEEDTETKNQRRLTDFF